MISLASSSRISCKCAWVRASIPDPAHGSSSTEELLNDGGPSYSMSIATKKPSSMEDQSKADKNSNLDTESISVSR